jgi:hypothetical protein
MSEVDRLSSAGLSPAAPVGDRRQSRQGSSSPDAHPDHPPAQPPGAQAGGPAADPTGGGRIPKSLIDEYA